MLVLRDIASLNGEQGLCGVVWAHLVLLIESGLHETELCETPVEVHHPHYRKQSEPCDLVAEAGAAGTLKLGQVELAGHGRHACR